MQGTCLESPIRRDTSFLLEIFKSSLFFGLVVELGPRGADQALRNPDLVVEDSLQISRMYVDEWEEEVTRADAGRQPRQGVVPYESK